MKNFFDFKNQSANVGQTLIETIVAIAILTTGIIGGLALAIQSLSSSERVTNEIIATNLAREGVEAARHTRDNNWNHNNLEDCDYIASGQDCVPEWANFGGLTCNIITLNVNLVAGNTSPSCRNYRVHLQVLSVGGNVAGRLYLQNQGSIFNTANYRLYLRPEGVYNHDSSGNPVVSNFYRRVRIFRETSSPFSNDNFRIRVESTVWWQSHGCQNVSDEEITTNCKVIVEEYLTNWKNY